MRFRKEAVLPVALVTVALGLGMVTAARIMFYSPDIHLSAQARKVPIRDTHGKANQYVAHRKSVSKLDHYVAKPAASPGEAEKSEETKQ